MPISMRMFRECPPQDGTTLPMRDELAVGLIVAVAALVLQRVVEVLVSLWRTCRERKDWAGFLDQWLADSVAAARRTRSILIRFRRPWREFVKTLDARMGTANLPEFPMLRLERPSINDPVTTKFALIRKRFDPRTLIRIDGTLNLVRRSLDSIIQLGLEAAKNRELMLTQPPMSQSVLGEIENSIEMIDKIADLAAELPRKRFPLSSDALDERDDEWSQVLPLMPIPHECRPAGSVDAPTRVEVVSEMLETSYGTTRILRTSDGRTLEEAFPGHEWREAR